MLLPPASRLEQHGSVAVLALRILETGHDSLPAIRDVVGSLLGECNSLGQRSTSSDTQGRSTTTSWPEWRSRLEPPPGPRPASTRIKGLPVLRALSLCTCCHHYPGAATGGTASLIHPAVSVFPGMAAGSTCALTFSRLARRSLALRPAHSRSHQFVARFTRRLQSSRHLHDCSGCFRLERLPGGPCTHWKAPPLHGARHQLSFTGAARATA